MEPRTTLALALDLRLTTVDEGGRRTPISGYSRTLGELQYRPDWASPGGDGDLSAGWVIGFSEPEVAPGQRVRAVIVAAVPHSLPYWQQVEVGAVLPMHEGPRVCGHGTVVWTLMLTMPLAGDDEAAVRAWLDTPAG